MFKVGDLVVLVDGYPGTRIFQVEELHSDFRMEFTDKGWDYSDPDLWDGYLYINLNNNKLTSILFGEEYV